MKDVQYNINRTLGVLCSYGWLKQKTFRSPNQRFPTAKLFTVVWLLTSFKFSLSIHAYKNDTRKPIEQKFTETNLSTARTNVKRMKCEIFIEKSFKKFFQRLNNFWGVFSCNISSKGWRIGPALQCDLHRLTSLFTSSIQVRQNIFDIFSHCWTSYQWLYGLLRTKIRTQVQPVKKL